MMSSQDQFEDLERALKRALRREDPPEGFDLRVIAKLRERELAHPSRPRIFSWMRTPVFRFAASAALLLAIFSGVVEYQRIERRREAGEAARRELLLALRITGSKLQYAQDKVNRSGEKHYGSDASDSEKQQ